VRIVHIITRLIVGGAQENTVDTVLGLQDRYASQIHLISGPTYGPEGSIEGRVASREGLLLRAPHLVRPIHPWNDSLAYFEILHQLQRLRPKIVHTHSGKAGFIGRLAAHRAHVPCIIHGIHGPSFGPFQGVFANLTFRTAERLADRVTDHFVTVAHAMSEHYQRAGIGRSDQFTRILSGFDLTPFLHASQRPRDLTPMGWAEDCLVVGILARLFKLKGHDDLLDCAPALLTRFPHVRFLFVGGGEWEDRLKARASQGPLRDKVFFTGLVPPNEVPTWIGRMDVLVHLSRREGLPRALSQAAATAKPTVAYDCDGAKEICIDGQTGFLVPPGDSVSLLDRLSQLVSQPQLRTILGRKGQSLAQQDFSVETMVERTWGLYQRMLQDPVSMKNHRN